MKTILLADKDMIAMIEKYRNQELLAKYYKQEQVVKNLQRELRDAEVQLEEIRRYILPEKPTAETNDK